jgi:hypothetical protein
MVDIYMTKGEGAPALLQNLDSLLSVPAASQSNRGREGVTRRGT